MINMPLKGILFFTEILITIIVTIFISKEIIYFKKEKETLRAIAFAVIFENEKIITSFVAQLIFGSLLLCNYNIVYGEVYIVGFKLLSCFFLTYAGTIFLIIRPLTTILCEGIDFEDIKDIFFGIIIFIIDIIIFTGLYHYIKITI